MKQSKSMAHHWYDALPVCRLFCIIGDWSPNSSHWKVLKKRNIIQRTISNSLRFARLTWHIWDSTLCCIAFRRFPNVTFIRLCLDPSLLYFFTALLHSWSHPHRTPSLSPFISDLVRCQIQLRQGGVLFHGLGQCLEGQETNDLRNTNEAHSTHHTANMQQSHHSSSHPLSLGFMQENPLCQCNLLPDWKSGLTIFNFDKELFWAILEIDFWWSWTCQVVLTTNIAQPPSNSWSVHPYLSCLIPLLPYTNFTSSESHPFHHFSLYSIHFTIW